MSARDVDRAIEARARRQHGVFSRRQALLADEPSVPTPTWQAPLPWRPTAPQRVDGLIEPWKVVLEADGRRWHTRVVDFGRDHDRDLTALRHGYVVARFTWVQLIHRPVESLATLVAIGATRLATARSTL